MKKPVTHKRIATLKLPKQVALLLAVARAIAQALQANVKSFPNPNPPVAAINTAADDLESADASVKAGTKGAAAARDAKVRSLVDLLEEEKAYVQSRANADPANAEQLIQSAAMGVKKVPVRVPRVFGARQGALSGSAALVTGSVGRRASYEWEYSQDAGKTWQAASPTMQAKTVVSGLQPGVSYSFRFRSVTKAGASDWSEATTLIVR